MTSRELVSKRITTATPSSFLCRFYRNFWLSFCWRCDGEDSVTCRGEPPVRPYNIRLKIAAFDALVAQVTLGFFEELAQQAEDDDLFAGYKSQTAFHRLVQLVD